MKLDIPTQEFKAIVTAKIRDSDLECQSWDTEGSYTYVDWSELDKAIDELCDEFKARQK